MKDIIKYDHVEILKTYKNIKDMSSLSSTAAHYKVFF